MDIFYGCRQNKELHILANFCRLPITKEVFAITNDDEMPDEYQGF